MLGTGHKLVNVWLLRKAFGVLVYSIYLSKGARAGFTAYLELSAAGKSTYHRFPKGSYFRA